MFLEMKSKLVLSDGRHSGLLNLLVFMYGNVEKYKRTINILPGKILIFYYILYIVDNFSNTHRIVLCNQYSNADFWYLLHFFNHISIEFCC